MNPSRVPSLDRHRPSKVKPPRHPHGIERGDVVEGPGPLGGRILYPVVDARKSCVLLKDTDGYCFVLGARRLGDLWAKHEQRRAAA